MQPQLIHPYQWGFLLSMILAVLPGRSPAGPCWSHFPKPVFLLLRSLPCWAEGQRFLVPCWLCCCLRSQRQRLPSPHTAALLAQLPSTTAPKSFPKSCNPTSSCSVIYTGDFSFRSLIHCTHSISSYVSFFCSLARSFWNLPLIPSTQCAPAQLLLPFPVCSQKNQTTRPKAFQLFRGSVFPAWKWLQCCLYKGFHSASVSVPAITSWHQLQTRHRVPHRVW